MKKSVKIPVSNETLMKNYCELSNIENYSDNVLVEKLAYAYAAQRMQRENIKPKNNRAYWVCYQMFSNGQIAEIERELNLRDVKNYNIDILFKKSKK